MRVGTQTRGKRYPFTPNSLENLRGLISFDMFNFKSINNEKLFKIVDDL